MRIVVMAKVGHKAYLDVFYFYQFPIIVLYYRAASASNLSISYSSFGYASCVPGASAHGGGPVVPGADGSITRIEWFQMNRTVAVNVPPGP